MFYVNYSISCPLWTDSGGAGLQMCPVLSQVWMVINNRSPFTFPDQIVPCPPRLIVFYRVSEKFPTKESELPAKFKAILTVSVVFMALLSVIKTIFVKGSKNCCV